MNTTKIMVVEVSEFATVGYLASMAKMVSSVSSQTWEASQVRNIALIVSTMTKVMNPLTVDGQLAPSKTTTVVGNPVMANITQQACDQLPRHAGSRGNSTTSRKTATTWPDTLRLCQQHTAAERALQQRAEALRTIAQNRTQKRLAQAVDKDFGNAQSKGGLARAAKSSPAKRRAIARKAAVTRWSPGPLEMRACQRSPGTLRWQRNGESR